MCLFQIPLIHATVAPLLMPDSPTRMSISATMCLSSSALLSPRPGWNLRWCYHRSVPKPLCGNRHSVGNIITVPSGINPRATVASIQVLFRGIKASIQPHFALFHAHGLGILHYHECYIAPTQGNLPTFQLNATVRVAFIPDSALEFLSIFSGSKCTK